MWHFKHANYDHIKRAIDIFDWESALNHIDANDPVSVFNSAILNIVSNFILNETITCDDRDPPWMDSYKKPCLCKRSFYKKFVCKSNNMYRHKNFNKIAQRLGDPNTSSKCY